MPVATVLPIAAGLAVHAAGSSRILPWPVGRQLLDDPALTVQTAGWGEASPWDVERLLAAQAAGDPAAEAAFGADGRPHRGRIQDLRRHPRRWGRTIDLGVVAGDLEAACCRAGAPLPQDALEAVAAIARLLERHQGEIAVRQRLLADHPWIGDAAWMSATGMLAETVVLHGRRRDQVRMAPVAGSLPVAALLARPERFTAGRPDVGEAMRSILDGTAQWDDRGHLRLRPAGGWSFTVGGVAIALGVGGMHSLDLPAAVAGPLADLDVASYYPSIIAADAISPPQLPDFATRVGALMGRRLAAKAGGDRIASLALKLVINSLYGQLGNARSGLFSPPDALRVVLTGQLRLLQLIDAVLAHGCDLVSANTDGIIVRGEDRAAAAAWQAATGLALERTPYARLWRTSVNDYVATAPDGGVAKSKGRFAGGDDPEATRRAAAPIVARAAIAHLVHGRGIAATVAAAGRVTDFALWRRARDLHWDGVPVAAGVVRWVVGPAGRPIVQVGAGGGSGSTVAAQAIPIIDPATVPLAAIDRGWYVAEAQALVDKVLGTSQGTRQQSLFDA